MTQIRHCRVSLFWSCLSKTSFSLSVDRYFRSVFFACVFSWPKCEKEEARAKLKEDRLFSKKSPPPFLVQSEIRPLLLFKCRKKGAVRVEITKADRESKAVLLFREMTLMSFLSPRPITMAPPFFSLHILLTCPLMSGAPVKLNQHEKAIKRAGRK